MKFSLQDKVVVITGASTGIGAEVGRLCAAKGAKVILVARSQEVLADLAKQISSQGGEALVMTGDIRRQEDIDRIIHEALVRWGKIDVLINNAGFGVWGTFADVSLEIVRRNFETNLFGSLAFTKAVLPHFLKHKSGMIVNVESIVALRSMPYSSCYSATKHALHAFSEAMRVELSEQNIHVLSVCPGLIRTPFGKNRIQVGPDMEGTPSWFYMPVEKCAVKILRAMETKKRRLIVTGHAKILAFLQRLSPRIVDAIASSRFPRVRKAS
jgi:short-subunit dehydrogenase